MRLAAALRHTLCGLALLVLGPTTAHAHKASDSYLQIDAGETGTTLRWDIALRDLDAAIDIDTNEDARLTWAEVKTAWPRIEAYALPRLGVAGCVLRPTGHALERRNDGAYAVLMLASDCVLAPTPAIGYTLFREVDPTHRGIAKLQRAGQPPTVVMLDPTHAIGSAATTASAAPPEASAPSGALGFLREGVRHILTGYDHVLFLLCLLLPSVMRRTPEPLAPGRPKAGAHPPGGWARSDRGQTHSGWRPVEKLSQAVWPVIGIVSAFTVAHSITLGLAALKIVALPSALIEPAIAVTIILAALDNVWPIFPIRRVVVTFFFGLIHGFGFAGVLAELNLPTSEFVRALLEFNVGLELGQLMIVIGVTALLFVLRQWPRYRPLVIRGGSYAAIVVGLLWLVERTANVSLLPM
ncbi:MAG TPA: HupE/UreJ family protein [Burkholderiaceae bacterium]|nr:HupE/UreJ family protein [Burkholderiaceae bacterium]